MAPRQSSQPAMPGSPSDMPFSQASPFYHVAEKGSNDVSSGRFTSWSEACRRYAQRAATLSWRGSSKPDARARCRIVSGWRPLVHLPGSSLSLPRCLLSEERALGYNTVASYGLSSMNRMAAWNLKYLSLSRQSIWGWLCCSAPPADSAIWQLACPALCGRCDDPWPKDVARRSVQKATRL